MAKKNAVKPKIIHHFADGVVSDTCKGVYVPYEGNEIIYHTIASVLKSVNERTAAKQRAAALAGTSEK